MSRISTFLERYPDAQITGGSILAIKQAMGDTAAPYFEAAGLVDLEPEKMYPFRLYLRVIEEIVKNEPNVTSNLVSIGMNVVETAPLPQEIDTLEKALMGLQHTWEMNTIDANPVNWETEKRDEKTFICTNYSPFPKDMEYGVVYGFARRFSKGERFTVEYEDLADREDEDKNAISFIVKID